jgi:hypothetical protein
MQRGTSNLQKKEGTEHHRTFVWGHIVLGHIVLASKFR